MPLLAGPALAPGSLAGRSQPVLTVDEFVLRPWRADDAAAVVAAYADPGIQRWHGHSVTMAEASAWIDARCHDMHLHGRLAGDPVPAVTGARPTGPTREPARNL